MQLMVNGEPRACPEGLNLDAALTAMGFKPPLVVVEFNGVILPRDRWSS